MSEKTAETYRTIFQRHGAGQAMMVGNSLKSDVLPAIAAGAHGVHVPHALTWALEHAEAPLSDPRFHALPDLAALPDLVDRLSKTLP